MSSRSQSHAGQRLARRTQQQRRTLATPTRAKSCTLCCRRRRPLAASNARLEGLATQPGPQGIRRAIVMCARQHKLAQVAYCQFERTLTDGLKGDRCTPPVFSIYKKDTKVDESSMPHNLEAVVLKLDQLLRLCSIFGTCSWRQLGCRVRFAGCRPSWLLLFVFCHL